MTKITFIKQNPGTFESYSTVNALTPSQKAARYISVNAVIKNSLQIYKWAQSVKARAGHRCEQCGSTIEITAHHVRGVKQIIEEEGITTLGQALGTEIFQISNGVALCSRCHKKVHGIQQ